MTPNIEQAAQELVNDFVFLHWQPHEISLALEVAKKHLTTAIKDLEDGNKILNERLALACGKCEQIKGREQEVEGGVGKDNQTLRLPRLGRLL